jgi:hypothetical protein
VRFLDDRPDVLKAAAAEEDERDRHERGAIVDRVDQPIDGRAEAIVRRHDHDLGAVAAQPENR